MILYFFFLKLSSITLVFLMGSTMKQLSLQSHSLVFEWKANKSNEEGCLCGHWEITFPGENMICPPISIEKKSMIILKYE